MNKEQQIDALEAQVREQYPSWNNADIRNQAVRMFYMDIITVQQIIKMIDYRLKQNSIEFNSVHPDDMPDEMYYRLLGADNELMHLNEELQSFIEAELNSAENQTVE